MPGGNSFGAELRRRRLARGWGQGALAMELRRVAREKGVPEPSLDGNAVSRWERGRQEPDPFYQLLLCGLFVATPEALGLEPVSARRRQGGGRAAVPSGLPAPLPAQHVPIIDDMDRREFLRLLSLTATAMTLSSFGGGIDWDRITHMSEHPSSVDDGVLDEHARLNALLWQVFRSSVRKRSVFDQVRAQTGTFLSSLQQSHSAAHRKRLCFLAGDLFQLAGEIFFDLNQYADAAQAYAIAATASKEADAYDLWACAMTRHAFIPIFEQRFNDAVPLLDMAGALARRGDPSLSTSQWVGSVSAQAFAGLGDAARCEAATNIAGEVRALSPGSQNGGWLRFDGTRIDEEQGACLVSLRRPIDAEAVLTRALRQPLPLRRQGLVLTNLARAAVQRREVDQACVHAHAAAEVLRQTGSGAVKLGLAGLSTELLPFENVPSASRLIAQLASA